MTVNFLQRRSLPTSFMWTGAIARAPPAYPTPAIPATGEDGAIGNSSQSLATGDSAASHRAHGRGRRETSAPTMLEHTRCPRGPLPKAVGR